MIESIGSYSLSIAVLTSAASVLAAITAYRFDSSNALIWTRRLLLSSAALITLASGALMAAILGDDFSFTYVAGYSEKALPIGYKVAAFWAGQAGSLLLWAWLIAAMTTVLIYQQRQQRGAETAITLAAMALVNGFFAALILFAANPFLTLSSIPGDGHGLNPMLQDPGMIAHPPALFIGYAGFTVPFAMLLGALVSGRTDDRWILATRRWILFSWLLLSVGILLGAQWAYIELGWGGYWAWDPVENASLLPWLTATALLHSIMVQQYRSGFRFWNAALIAATFLLCIFGTYLTRSGVIQSVHTFPESPIGRFFLAFMAVCLLITVPLMIARRKQLKPDQPLTGLFHREGAFLLTNVLLVIITATTLVGTIYPLISVFFTGQPISVGPPFYNKVVLPMAMALLLLMAIGPALNYGVSDPKGLAMRLRLPATAAILAVLVALTLGLKEPWSLTCIAISVLGVVNILADLIRLGWKTLGHSQENPVTALVRIIDDNHRRYGGQFVHLGMILVMIGVAGSSIYTEKTTVQLKIDEQSNFAGYTLTYQGLSEHRRGNYTAVQAAVLLVGSDGLQSRLLPEIRYYDKSEQPNTHVALQTGLRRDLYVTLAGWDQQGALVAIQAIVNPLVAWIWIGGIVMIIGTIFALTPRLLQPRPQPQLHAAPAMQQF